MTTTVQSLSSKVSLASATKDDSQKTSKKQKRVKQITPGESTTENSDHITELHGSILRFSKLYELLPTTTPKPEQTGKLSKLKKKDKISARQNEKEFSDRFMLVFFLAEIEKIRQSILDNPCVEQQTTLCKCTELFNYLNEKLHCNVRYLITSKGYLGINGVIYSTLAEAEANTASFDIKK